MPGNTRKPPKRVVEAVERLLRALSERGVRVEKAYLFGSYARGDWLRTSDVDLVVVSSDFSGMRFTERLELVYRAEWEERLKPFIEVIPLTPNELEERLKESSVLRDAPKYWIPIHANHASRPGSKPPRGSRARHTGR